MRRVIYTNVQYLPATPCNRLSKIDHLSVYISVRKRLHGTYRSLRPLQLTSGVPMASQMTLRGPNSPSFNPICISSRGRGFYA